MKVTRVVIILLLLLGLSSVLLLRSYRLELVEVAVLHALLERSPSDFSRQVILDAFDKANQKAKEEKRTSVYLDQLFRISQRLEKVQSVNSDQVTEMLLVLNPLASQL